MVEELKAEHLGVNILCKTLEVSRSGYYAWRSRPVSEREQEGTKLSLRVREIFEKSRGTYGAPRIQKQLAAAGEKHGKERIRKIMRKAQKEVRENDRLQARSADRTAGDPDGEPGDDAGDAKRGMGF